MKVTKKPRFSAIDIFSGCGGLSLGLRRAGFRIIAAIDKDALSIATYRMNHKRTMLVNEDIRSIEPGSLMQELSFRPGQLDLLAGCPPCQGFSTLRTMNGGRSVEEPMNDLVFEFVRFVRTFLPKTVMMENVPALLEDDRLKQVRRDLEIMDYATEASCFNAENFGVPQRRKRMILMGARNDVGCPSFADTVRQRRTVAGAIRRLTSPHSSDDTMHNYSVRRADHVMSLIRRILKDGGSRTDLPQEDQLECHKRIDGFKNIYGRMAWRKPAPTITGGCISPSKGRFLHPEEDRAITLREAAMLQGFPQSYEFDMSNGRNAAAQLIGNAFPPKFAEHHARQIYRHLSDL